MEELVELGGIEPSERLLPADEPFLDEVDGDLHHRRRVALRRPRLQKEELAVLDRELDVLRVAVVLLEPAHGVEKLLEDVGEAVAELFERLRRADAGDDVLALRVGEKLTVEPLLAGGRVPREGDARARFFALVPEHHLDDVDRGAEVVRDPVRPAVRPRPREVPGVEDRADRSGELVARVLREVLARVLAVDLLEAPGQLLELLGAELAVVRRAGAVARLRKRLLEALRVDSGDDVAVHLDQPPVRVVGETRVPGRAREPLDGLVVQPEIEDRVHHPGHGDRGSGAHRYEEWVARIAEPLARRLLEPGHVLRDLLLQAGGNLPLCPHVRDAGRGRDREAGRDGNSDRRHLGEADPLAAEQLAAELRSFREVEDVAVVHSGQDYRGFFGRLDGPKADSDTDAMRRMPLMLALLALLVMLSVAGGGFFDGHL